MGPRRTKAGGAKKRPTRYAAPIGTPDDLAAALRAHRKGLREEAAERYAARLAREPGCVDSAMNLAALHALAGRAQSGAAAYDHALAWAPDDARVWRDAAIGFSSIGALTRARDASQRAIALDPTSIGSYLVRARVCAELGDRSAAMTTLSDARAVAPGDPSVHLELHRVLFDDRDLGPCIDAARDAVALDPSYGLARFFLAGALGLAGRRSESTEALGRPGLVAPGLADALTFALDQQSRGARYFASKHDLLVHGIEQARLPGPILEFGVRHGVSTRLLAARVAGMMHAFDSFDGLPEPWQGRAPGAFTTSGELPRVPENVAVHVGLFEDTLPAFVAELREPPRLIHVDSDLYTSARTVLRTLAPAIRPGCVIIFDELIGNASWRDDEHRAWTEAVLDHGWAYEPRALSWITGQGAFEIVTPD